MLENLDALRIVSVLLLTVTPMFAEKACHRQAATSQSPPAQVGRAGDYQGLLAKLRAAGAEVSEVAPDGEISQPFFSVSGRLITVNGASVQVFEYAKAAVAETESSRVSSDGTSVGTTMINWAATPHFYRSERLIVLYVGDDQAVTRALEGALGRQFAGG